jgi:hypothetical protein
MRRPEAKYTGVLKNHPYAPVARRRALALVLTRSQPGPGTGCRDSPFCSSIPHCLYTLTAKPEVPGISPVGFSAGSIIVLAKIPALPKFMKFRTRIFLFRADHLKTVFALAKILLPPVPCSRSSPTLPISRGAIRIGYQIRAPDETYFAAQSLACKPVFTKCECMRAFQGRLIQCRFN